MPEMSSTNNVLTTSHGHMAVVEGAQPFWETFRIDEGINTISQMASFMTTYLDEVRHAVNRIGDSQISVEASQIAFTYLQAEVSRAVVNWTWTQSANTATLASFVTKQLTDMRIAMNTVYTTLATDSPWTNELELALSIQVKILLTLCQRLVQFRRSSTASKMSRDDMQAYLKGIIDFLNSVPNTPPETRASFENLTTQLNETSMWKKFQSRVGRATAFLSTSPTGASELETDKRNLAEKLHAQRGSRDSTSAAKITELEEREISELRKLRARLQLTLAHGNGPASDPILLHRSETHLFQPRTYIELITETEAFYKAATNERDDSLLLLKKSFELKALEEVAKVVKRATTCYARIGDSYDRLKYATVVEFVLELASLQRRTWIAAHAHIEVDPTKLLRFLEQQQGFPKVQDKFQASAKYLSDTLREKQPVPASILQHVYNVLLETPPPSLIAKGVSFVGRAVLRRGQQYGGDGNEEEAGTMTGEDPFARPPVAPVFDAVIKQRLVVRELLRGLMTAIARVERLSTNVGAERALFTDLVLLPFLRPITLEWNVVLEKYLKPQVSAPDEEVPHGFASAEQRKNAKAVAERMGPRALERVVTNLSSGNILLLQLIKVFRLFVQIGAAFVAQKVFNESYMRKVFSEGRDPPPLKSMLFLMASIDATAHLMVVLVLVLSSFAFKAPLQTFIIDDVFLADVLTEFAVSSTVFIVIGLLMGDILRRKRYFQYADQGQVVSSAFRSILLSVCAVNFVVPYSMLIS